MLKLIDKLMTFWRTESPVAKRQWDTPKLIFCGDCSMRLDTDMPRPTRLTATGHCASCGGRAYVLAAHLAPLLAGTLKARRAVPVYSDAPPNSIEAIREKNRTLTS